MQQLVGQAEIKFVLGIPFRKGIPNRLRGDGSNNTWTFWQAQAREVSPLSALWRMVRSWNGAPATLSLRVQRIFGHLSLLHNSSSSFRVWWFRHDSVPSDPSWTLCGCGSQIGAQTGTLVSGNILKPAVPWWFNFDPYSFHHYSPPTTVEVVPLKTHPRPPGHRTKGHVCFFGRGWLILKGKSHRKETKRHVHVGVPTKMLGFLLA